MPSILVIDDASIMRLVLKDILHRYCQYEKHDIHEAMDGQQAIFKYSQVKPEIVLCDIAMPDLSGIDVVRAIIGKDPDAKIIMVTASSDAADVRECIRAGARDYIIKPPKPERVMLAIEKGTGRKLVKATENKSTLKPNDLVRYADDEGAVTTTEEPEPESEPEPEPENP